MSFGTKVYLWMFTAMFGIGAIANWSSSPVAAGMMFMASIGCYALLVLGRVTTHWKGKPVDDSRATALSKEIVEAIEEYGTFRIEGEVKVFCPLCKTWCTADKITPNAGLAGGFILGTDPGTSVAHIHVEVLLHAHNHECVGADEVIATINRSSGHDL